MKTHYNNVPIEQGEVSVVLSEMSGDIIRHSCELAKTVRDKGIDVLLVNCVASRKRFQNVADTVIRPRSYAGRTHCRIRTVVQGNMYGDRDAIDEIAKRCNISIVIICGWEWTSDCWRRKRSLMFYLRGLMDREDVAIVIYSQASTKPVAGKYDRGGLGSIAQLAVVIVQMEFNDEQMKETPPPPPLIVDPEEWEAAGRSAQLLTSKINNLETKRNAVPVGKKDVP